MQEREAIKITALALALDFIWSKEMDRETEIKNALEKMRKLIPTIASTPGDRIEFNMSLGRTMDELERRFVNFDRQGFLSQLAS
jgi:hypothetical protein